MTMHCACCKKSNNNILTVHSVPICGSCKRLYNQEWTTLINKNFNQMSFTQCSNIDDLIKIILDYLKDANLCQKKIDITDVEHYCSTSVRSCRACKFRRLLLVFNHVPKLKYDKMILLSLKLLFDQEDKVMTSIHRLIKKQPLNQAKLFKPAPIKMASLQTSSLGILKSMPEIQNNPLLGLYLKHLNRNKKIGNFNPNLVITTDNNNNNSNNKPVKKSSDYESGEEQNVKSAKDSPSVASSESINVTLIKQPIPICRSKAIKRKATTNLINENNNEIKSLVDELKNEILPKDYNYNNNFQASNKKCLAEIRSQKVEQEEEYSCILAEPFGNTQGLNNNHYNALCVRSSLDRLNHGVLHKFFPDIESQHISPPFQSNLCLINSKLLRFNTLITNETIWKYEFPDDVIHNRDYSEQEAQSVNALELFHSYVTVMEPEFMRKTTIRHEKTGHQAKFQKLMANKQNSNSYTVNCMIVHS